MSLKLLTAATKVMWVDMFLYNLFEFWKCIHTTTKNHISLVHKGSMLVSNLIQVVFLAIFS